eukprot:CAMPEP_0198133290 /NCGR_PEP_ID=MMETSP1442-20131203/59487_1 /TAXON_ID= /ORGANISM="Craspedostauros australis, Strain CCMP3328" /LENGTH=393 /DNA_ID=CAMNT_0043794405 /DNA_START=150 /DNA_END=1332 /DNA_ORIENTATION=+
MRLTSTQVSALFAASTLAGVSAFNALPTTSKPMRPTHSAGAAIPTSTTSLHVGMTLNMPPSREDGEFDGSDPFMVTQMAQDCADSDTCSVEDAEKYLRGLLMIQSDCAANILDEENAICRDVGTAAALVAALRDKIKFGQAELARQTNVNTVASFGLGAAALLFASTLAVSVLSAQPDAAPFTMQEWWWAARDGYLGTMMAHFVRHGGLVAAEGVDGTQSNSNPLLMTLTLREWVWAIQGGYFDNMVVQLFREGGMASDDVDIARVGVAIQGGYFDNMVVQLFREGGMELASVASSAPASAMSPSSSLLQETASAASSLDGVLVANLTPQEVWWAIRGSYLDTLLSHVYHNGGLAVTDYDSDAVSFSIEEWKHAMRDGYMGDMVASFYTKGGL